MWILGKTSSEITHIFLITLKNLLMRKICLENNTICLAMKMLNDSKINQIKSCIKISTQSSKIIITENFIWMNVLKN